jgi:hypothetical protein
VISRLLMTCLKRIPNGIFITIIFLPIVSVKFVHFEVLEDEKLDTDDLQKKRSSQYFQLSKRSHISYE